jgi:hypothetical protein
MARSKPNSRSSIIMEKDEIMLTDKTDVNTNWRYVKKHKDKSLTSLEIEKSVEL